MKIHIIAEPVWEKIKSNETVKTKHLSNFFLQRKTVDILVFWCMRVRRWSNQESPNCAHCLALMITYHEDCDLDFGSRRTTHCQFWLEANLYGVRNVTHRGPQGLTAFWPSVCPLGWSIIHVGVMHLSPWLCIVSSTKKSGVGEWQIQFNASSSCILQQEPSSVRSLCLHSNGRLEV